MSTKQRIIQASIELFNLHGERAITTNHIAAHLNMSPGNLYYHFPNKEAIIRGIFALYREHLQQHFVVPTTTDNTLNGLGQLLTSLFELFGRFHFFYDNLPTILARDDELAVMYRTQQQELLAQLVRFIHALNDQKILAIPASDVEPFAHNLKLTVSGWVPYVKTRQGIDVITNAILYRGVVQTLLLFKPYMLSSAQVVIAELMQHYQALAESES